MEDRMDKRFAEMEDRMDKRFAEMEDRMDKRFGEVNARLDRLEERVGNLEQGMAKVEVRLDHIEKHLDRIEERVDNLECRMSNVEMDIAELRQMGGETNRRLTAVEVCLRDDIMPRLEHIEECYVGTYERYQEASKEIPAMKLDISMLKQKFDTGAGSVAENIDDYIKK